VDGSVELLQAFRPEQFFLGRTRGWGVLRQIDGKRRRCEVVTEGALDETYQALHFDETFSFDDGEVQEWRWAMTRQRDGRYVAAEAMAGAGIIGRHLDGDYVLAFKRPMRPEGGFPTPRYNTRFTLLNPRVALKRTRVMILGVPVGSLTAFHERID
jgi:hypothetical protein